MNPSGNEQEGRENMADIQKYSEQTFESIKHINEYGQEFWYARELQAALEYSQWRRFEEAIERAKIACEQSGNPVADHFANVGKMVADNIAAYIT